MHCYYINVQFLYTNIWQSLYVYLVSNSSTVQSVFSYKSLMRVLKIAEEILPFQKRCQQNNWQTKAVKLLSDQLFAVTSRYWIGGTLKMTVSHQLYYRPTSKIRELAPAECWNWDKWGLKEVSFLVWFVGLVMKVQEIFVLPRLLWSDQYKIFFLSPYSTLFQLTCPHRPASWAGNRAGSHVS